MSQDTTMQSNDRQQQSAAARMAGDERLTASEAAVECFKEYAKEHPEVVALWAFGIGIVLGWKLKPW